jgi:hypothetical protein
MNLVFHLNEVIEMKKILSFMVVGLMVYMGSAVNIQHGSIVSAAVLFVNHPSPQMGYANNSPPSNPVITGQTKGKHDVSYNFTFTSTDPDGDNVSYWIEWGDGCPSAGWLGLYPSGQTITVAHIFPKGTWTVECKAKDIHNATSGWGTLKVSMPLTLNMPSHGLWERLLAWFPHAFPILRYLLGW